MRPGPMIQMGTRDGFPDPPATGSGGLSPPPPNAIQLGTRDGFPCPPATGSGGLSPPPPNAIERLTRRLAGCPPEHLGEPRLSMARGGDIQVDAVVADLLDDLGAEVHLGADDARIWAHAGAKDRNRLRVTLVACWLAHDDGFRAACTFAAPVARWLTDAIPPLAEVVEAELFVTDPDRREELARSLLDALGLLPEGELPAMAADRLKALSSVERARIIRDTRAAQERARRLRAEMEAERAREAAARYSPE